MNDFTVTQSEWVSGPTPTFVSTTQFTVAGDKTADFQVDRRVRVTVTAGTLYGEITAASYSDPNTTVTVELDSGNLDAGLSAVDYGLITADNPSVHINALAEISAMAQGDIIFRGSSKLERY